MLHTSTIFKWMQNDLHAHINTNMHFLELSVTNSFKESIYLNWTSHSLSLSLPPSLPLPAPLSLLWRDTYSSPVREPKNAQLVPWMRLFFASRRVHLTQNSSLWWVFRLGQATAVGARPAALRIEENRIKTSTHHSHPIQTGISCREWASERVANDLKGTFTWRSPSVLASHPRNRCLPTGFTTLQGPFDSMLCKFRSLREENYVMHSTATYSERSRAGSILCSK